jgi:hypothetical protein
MRSAEPLVCEAKRPLVGHLVIENPDKTTLPKPNLTGMMTL